MKLYVFTSDMVLYTENPTKPTNNLLVLINEFSKTAGDKLNIQKSIVFFIHLQRTIQKWNLKKKSTYNSTKKNKKLWYENKRTAGILHRKLQNNDNGNWSSKYVILKLEVKNYYDCITY